MTSAIAVEQQTSGQRSRYASGLLIGIASAATFGLSGSLARSLLDAGWSPAAIVSTRISGAFLVLLIPCLILLRRIGRPTLRQSGRMVVYGVIAVAGAQFCYFSAVQYLSVGVALLLEYLAPVLLIGWHWATTRNRPAARVFVGAGLSLAGLALVLDLRSGLQLNPIGVLWGLGAAICLAGYFILAEENDGRPSVHPLLLTTAGTGVGGLVILTAGLVGVLPLTAHAVSTSLAGISVSWWLPVLLLILVSAVFAYLSGIVAVRRLGSSIASFVSLSEVLFAVIFAVILLGQHPSLIQLVGGVLVLGGIAVVQRTKR
jgi:drug/metabolite transporter (DMT)-like permease